MDDKTSKIILSRRLRWFENHEKELILDPRYAGRYVAVYNNNIQDSDNNDFELASRNEDLARKIGPIPICYVLKSLEERSELKRRQKDHLENYPDYISPSEE